MALKILCCGHLVRHPLGGHSWHHLQYLVGLARLGHEVVFMEHWGWPDSCYDPARDAMTSDATYGLDYLRTLLGRHGLAGSWCYLAEDGREHGMTREALAQFCRECDLCLNLSNMNWIDELMLCRRRALVDTDPVFTQIGVHGMAALDRYHALFSFGENVHRAGSTMPTGHASWQPTRQPVVLELWPVLPGDPEAPFTTVINWSPMPDHRHNGRVYGQKSAQFEPFFCLPHDAGQPMRIAVNAPTEVCQRLKQGGWELADPLGITRDAGTYQEFVRSSRGEFCVAKHAYVVTRCGWFSDRSTAYLASGRPVVVEDTGFSDFLPCGRGLLAYRDREEALAAIQSVAADYPEHCRAARDLVAEHFDSRRVLTQLLAESV